MTLYKILNNRKSCVRIIKEYAKNVVLDEFEYTIEKFSNAIHQLNVYLYYNAKCLNMNNEYINFRKKIILAPETQINFSQYINDTLEERGQLIQIIRESIMNMD